MSVILRRFMEFFALNLFLSATITGLYELGLLPASNTAIKYAMLISVIVYVIAHVLMLRQCFFDICNRYEYYLFNYLAYMIFMVINLAVFFLCNNIIFTWLFAITKFLKFIDIYMDTFLGLMFFHSIMLIAIALAPIGMGWVFMLRSEEEGYEPDNANLLDAEETK